MNHVKIPKFECVCGYKMDTTTEAKGQGVPNEGDISLCFNCGRINLFNKDLTVRVPTPAEMEEIKNSTEWSFIQKSQLEIYKRK